MGRARAGPVRGSRGTGGPRPGQKWPLPGRRACFSRAGFLLAGPASLLDLLIWALRPGSGKPGPAKRAGRAREGQAGPGRARGPGPARVRAGPGRGPSRARPGPAPHFANRPVSHPISPTRPRRPQLRAGPGGGGPYWSCPPLARPRATAGDPAAANPPHLHPAALYERPSSRVALDSGLSFSAHSGSRSHTSTPWCEWLPVRLWGGSNI